VAPYLYGSGRCAIAQAYADPIVDPDDVSDLRRLSGDLHIVKEIAEYLIANELKVSRSILV
jgi:Methylamine utilization protein MauJ